METSEWLMVAGTAALLLLVTPVIILLWGAVANMKERDLQRKQFLKTMERIADALLAANMRR